MDMKNKKISEQDIEKKLVKMVNEVGGMALKFVSPGNSGVPDRLVLIAIGKIAFVEVKAPGEKPRPLQLRMINKIRKLGFKVYVLDDVTMIGVIINEIQST